MTRASTPRTDSESTVQKTFTDDTISDETMQARRQARTYLGLTRQAAASLFPDADDTDTLRAFRSLFDSLDRQDMTLADHPDVVADVLAWAELPSGVRTDYPLADASALHPGVLSAAVDALRDDYHDIETALKNLAFFKNEEEIPEPVRQAADAPHEWDELDPENIRNGMCVCCEDRHYQVEIDGSREWVMATGDVLGEGVWGVDDPSATPYNTALWRDDDRAENAGYTICHRCERMMTEYGGPNELHVETSPGEGVVYRYFTDGDVVLDATIYPHWGKTDDADLSVEEFHFKGSDVERDAIYSFVRGDLSRRQATRLLAEHHAGNV